jgi:hypothetical protein
MSKDALWSVNQSFEGLKLAGKRRQLGRGRHFTSRPSLHIPPIKIYLMMAKVE